MHSSPSNNPHRPQNHFPTWQPICHRQDRRIKSASVTLRFTDYQPNTASRKSSIEATSYRPGVFADTSGHNDPDRVWIGTTHDEFPWLQDRTNSQWRDVRKWRKATCRASRQDPSQEEQVFVKTFDGIKGYHCEQALERVLILREELIGPEQTPAEWHESCTNVLDPIVIPRKTFSGRLHPSARQNSGRTLSKEVAEPEAATDHLVILKSWYRYSGI